MVGRGEDFHDLIGKSARIVGATCLFSANLFKENRWWGTQASQTTFDWAIVDEAGRATVPEILVPIVRADRAILVGDERQLPPMVDDELAAGAPQSEDDVALETSLFQILAERTEGEAKEHISGLRTQYRMHPAIGNTHKRGLLRRRAGKWLSRPRPSDIRLDWRACGMAVHVFSPQQAR